MGFKGEEGRGVRWVLEGGFRVVLWWFLWWFLGCFFFLGGFGRRGGFVGFKEGWVGEGGLFFFGGGVWRWVGGWFFFLGGRRGVGERGGFRVILGWFQVGFRWFLRVFTEFLGIL